MKSGTALLSMIALLTLGLSSPALAVDGVLEINQACAVNTGCFSGDAAGLPVKITATGSYRLTSNLTVPDENTHAIEVAANDVSIDLNGFAIIGPVTCSGSPVTCSPASGTGSGVVRFSSLFAHGTSVKNGSITGMGKHGVHLETQAEVTNLRVRWNGDDGIHAMRGSTVSGNTARQNGGEGIFVNASTVSGNMASQNGGNGIYTYYASTVSDNLADQNGDRGIFANGGSTVSGNTARENVGGGIYAGAGCTVTGNTAYQNGGPGIYAFKSSTVSGNTASENGDHGIHAGPGCTVIGNTSYGNTGYGLDFVAGSLIDYSAYSGNVITTNTAGTVTGPAVEFGQNVCNGSTTCP